MAVLLTSKRIGWVGVVLAVVGLLEYLVIQVAVSHHSMQSKIPVDLLPLFDNGQIHLQTIDENVPQFMGIEPPHPQAVANGSSAVKKQPAAASERPPKRTMIGQRVMHRAPPLAVDPHGPEVLVENDPSRSYRQLNALEQSGSDILMTLRTTASYHDKRLPLLFQTWMDKINRSNIFLVTDDDDKNWMEFTKAKGTFITNGYCQLFSQPAYFQSQECTM